MNCCAKSVWYGVPSPSPRERYGAFSSSGSEGRRNLAPERFLLEGFALVAQVFAAAHSDGDLDSAALQIHLERYERQALGLRLQTKLLYLLRMGEKLAHGFRIVVEAVPERVCRYVGPHEPKLALQDGDVRP